MASPFQQQQRQRKMLYLALILVLFTGAWGWRRYVIDGLADRLAIREEQRGEADLTGSIVRLSLMGSRGLVTCVLWNQAFEKQKLNQWNELEVLVRSLTKLQPHFITPWLFQSWNLAYNVSVEADRPRDKYFYVTRGVEILADGESKNRNHPDLRWHTGNYVSHKIGKSDETNYKRSLLQLSIIPPNERDPARFWKKTEAGPEIDYAEFEKFARAHPQMVRRLREGMARDTEQARRAQFTCASVAEVVQFLEDNARVPSLYRLPEAWIKNPTAQSRVWDPNAEDKMIVERIERFPALPPPLDDPARERQKPFDDKALTSASTLHDHDDPFTVAHAWWCYAMEPLPLPGDLPGSSRPIEDRARQRRPKNMTTLIFRSYPAQGLRSHAERLQEEGWFDEEKWDLTDWFDQAKGLAGRTVAVGGGTKWSEEAWARAWAAWRDHGEQNHLMLLAPADEENMKKKAAAFNRKYPPAGNGQPAEPRADALSEEDREGQAAARWLFERGFYIQVSNFIHFLKRTEVEKLPVTVACRKMFHRADRVKYAGKRNDRYIEAPRLMRLPQGAWSA
ncbi:MAG: hypothetical protein K2W96_06665, partial [Gemmataceae bacterium]|nr:hypothetical protein [Gemmataceae bacterium]